MPPRSPTTVGMAVETTVISIAAIERLSKSEMTVSGRFVFIEGTMLQMLHPRPRCNVPARSPAARLCTRGPFPALLFRDREARVGDRLLQISRLCLHVVVLDDHLALLAIRRGRLHAVDLLQLGLGLRRALLAFPAAHLDGVRLHVRKRGGARSERDREHER